MIIPSKASPRIFVSYSRHDQSFAHRVVSDLQKAGADVWVDEDDLGHGNFMQRIDGALKWAEWMILILTPSAIDSEFVQTEVFTALHRVSEQQKEPENDQPEYIGRITTAGFVTEYAVPPSNASPFGVVAGPAGNFAIWFTEQAGNKIAVVTTPHA